MAISDSLKVDLLSYANIERWKPEYGDIITRHRLMSWWGVVTAYDSSSEVIHVIRAANPQTLLTLGTLEQEKRTTKLDVVNIKRSKGYAIQQVRNGQSIWYIS